MSETRESQARQWLHSYTEAMENHLVCGRLLELFPDKSYQGKYELAGNQARQLWATKPTDVSWNQIVLELNRARPQLRKALRIVQIWYLLFGKVMILKIVLFRNLCSLHFSKMNTPVQESEVQETDAQHWLRQYKDAIGNQLLFTRLAELLPEKSYREKLKSVDSHAEQLWATKPAEVSWSQVLLELNKATPTFKRMIREQERWNLPPGRVI
jgi:hypothetical protein